MRRASSTKNVSPCPCQLPTLESPGLAETLPCIERREGLLTPDPRDFPCCQASGIHDDRLTNTVSRCDLIWRLERLRGLDVLQTMLWPESEAAVRPLDAARLTKAGHEALQRCKDSGAKGLILPTGVASGQAAPTWIWPLARAAVWRFGYAVHVVSIGRTPDNFLQIPADVTGTNVRRPVVVLVEAFQILAKPALGFALDLVLSSSDVRAVPLFLALDVGVSASDSGLRSPTARGQFARRLQSARSSTTVDTLLGPAAASRLESVSQRPQGAGVRLISD